MARATNLNVEEEFIKLLLIGLTKTGKSHWVMEAAEAGFNIFWLDGDVARQTINRKREDGTYFFSEAARNRVHYFYVGDEMGKPRFSKTVREMFDTPRYLWSETEQRRVRDRVDSLEDHEVAEISLAKLGANDILVVDTWTALSFSEKQEVAKRTGDDLGEMEKADRGIYASSGNRLTQYLDCLKAVRCHVVVIAHPDEYIEYKNPNKKVGDISEKERVIVRQTQIPMSSSKPHGASMGKTFTDILWMEVDGVGRRIINGRVEPGRLVGSRFTDRKLSSEYSFRELVRQGGGKNPDPSKECAAVVYHPAGSFAKPEAAPKVIGAGKGTPAKKVGGLAGLAKPK